MSSSNAPNLNEITLLALQTVQPTLSSGIKPRQRNTRTRTAFEELFRSAEDVAALLQEINILLANIESRASPASKKKRARAEERWELMVRGLEPELPAERVWHEETVKKYYLFMLPLLLRISKGTRGRTLVKARTLAQYKEMFCWAIARHTRNDAGENVGSFLLSKGQIVSTLDDLVYTLIKKHKLNRTEDIKLFYGEPELKLVVQEFINMSEKTSRLVALQKIAIVLTIFFTTVRPGSLGPSDKQYKEEDKFPTLRHVKIIRTGFVTYKVELSLHNFKGYNTSVSALTRKYVFEPVKQWCNVHLDISLYYVAFLLARGALEGVSTIDQLRKSNLIEIKIKESMLDEPLFLALTSGGKSFVDKTTPITAAGISEMIRTATENAGLAQGTAYCFRRGAANDYEILIGKEFAEQLLTHHAPGALHFYSENTANIDIVAARLDEMPIPIDLNRRHLLTKKQATNRASQAVIYLLKSTLAPSKGDGSDDSEQSSDEEGFKKSLVPRNHRSALLQLSKEQKLDLEKNNEEHREIQADIELKWKAFMACYPPTLRGHGNKIYKIYQGNIKQIRKQDALLVVPVEDVEKADAELRAAFNQRLTKRRQLYRRETKALRQPDFEMRRTSLAGTLDDVDYALQNLRAPSHLLVESSSIVAPIEFDAPPRQLSSDSAPQSVLEKARTYQRPAEASSTFLSSTMPLRAPAAFTPFSTTIAGPSTIPDASASFSDDEPDLDAVDNQVDTPMFAGIRKYMEAQRNDIVEDDYDETDKEVSVLVRNLRNRGGRKKSSGTGKGQKQVSASGKGKEKASQVVDEEDEEEEEGEPRQFGITDTESQEVDESIVDTPNVRSAYLEALIAPIVIQTAFESLVPLPDGKYNCPRCVKFFAHQPDRRDKTFRDIHNLWRHYTTMHTAWKELVLLMLTVDSEIFQCPLAPECTFIGDTEYEVREHCLDDCQGQEFFVSMKQEHIAIVREARCTRIGNVTSADFSQEKEEVELEWIKMLLEPYPNAFSAVIDGIHEIREHSGATPHSSTSDQDIGFAFPDLCTMYGV